MITTDTALLLAALAFLLLLLSLFLLSRYGGKRQTIEIDKTYSSNGDSQQHRAGLTKLHSKE